MNKKEITIKINKDTDLSEAVSKALNVPKQTHKTLKASKKIEEEAIVEGKFTSNIGEYKNIAG